MTKKEIEEKQKQLDIEKEELRKKENELYIKRSKSSRESRERAKERQKEIEPFIIAYVSREIKEGNIVRCKGYRGEKKVVEVKDYTQNPQLYGSIVAICGDISRKTGKFEANGSGSETYSGNVTEVLKDGKWMKIKDLVKDYKF